MEIELPEKDTLEIVHKELDLVENVITRMANNSFMIKGWCITLFIALMTFFNIKSLPDFILIIALVLVVILFGYLDAFYLMIERKYTKLYSKKIESRIKNMDFTDLYSLYAENCSEETVWDVIKNTKYRNDYESKHPSEKHIKLKAWWNALKRNTIAIFYGILVIFLIIYTGYCIWNYKNEKNNPTRTEVDINIKESTLKTLELENSLKKISSEIEKFKNSIPNYNQLYSEENLEIMRLNENIEVMNRNVKQIEELLRESNNTVGVAGGA